MSSKASVIARLGAALSFSVLVLGCTAPALAPTTAQAPAGVSATAPARQRIDKAADLPRFSYPVQGKLEDIVRSPERFAAFAAPLRRDTEAVLARYEIADKATHRQLLGLLATLDYLDGRYDDAVRHYDAVKSLEDKPADKLLSGLRGRAMAMAAKQHRPGTPAHAQAAQVMVKSQLATMPYAVIVNEIRQAKAGTEVMGENLMLGGLREKLQPIVDASGMLSSETAPGVVQARFGLTAILPTLSVWRQTFDEYLSANRSNKADIWAGRDVSLPPQGPYTQVSVAVWDSGVDSALFKPQLALGADGKPLVIGFDKYARPANTELMAVSAEFQGRQAQMVSRIKGFSDLQANIDSPEATGVKGWLSSLGPDQYKPGIEELTLASVHSHGTHVAGIALAGNPHARLVIARIEFGHTLMPDPCPSLELTQRGAATFGSTVDFLKRQGVRVVNMSWGGSMGETEAELEKCAPRQTPDERKALARRLFDIDRDALRAAIASAPGVLFVAAAGNSNDDASFNESIPASLVLANMITAGAVDLAGDEASFTSYGPTVKIHANGHQVDSYLPGGARVAQSGTSMAAPQVSNLAAKLLAVRPGLKPEELIQIITSTADKSSDGRRVLMNPKRALAAVAAMKG